MGDTGALLSTRYLQFHALAGGTGDDDPAEGRLAQVGERPLCPGNGTAGGAAERYRVERMKRERDP